METKNLTMETNNLAIGKYAGLSTTTANCIFIGLNAGADITEGDGIVIIGDNVTSLDKSQEGLIFIGEKIAIGKTLFGQPCNLSDLLNTHIKFI